MVKIKKFLLQRQLFNQKFDEYLIKGMCTLRI